MRSHLLKECFTTQVNTSIKIRVILLYPIFFWDTVLTSKRPTILGYQNITFDSFILILCSSNITCNNSFVIFDESLIFFLTFNSFILILCSSNITYDNFLSHLMVPLFFLTFNGYLLTLCSSILTLCNTNITCDSTFVTFGGSFIFFLTCNGSILTLCNFDIICDYFFVTFGGSLFFSPHLMVLLSH